MTGRRLSPRARRPAAPVRRTRRLNFTVTDTEYEQITAAATAAGLTTAAWCAKTALAASADDAATLADLAATLLPALAATHRLAAAASTGDAPAAAEAAARIEALLRAHLPAPGDAP